MIIVFPAQIDFYCTIFLHLTLEIFLEANECIKVEDRQLGMCKIDEANKKVLQINR